MDTTFRALIITFAILVGILAVVTGVALRNLTAARTSADVVNVTHATVAELSALSTSLQTAEAAVRTYVLTESEQSLRSYQKAFSELGEHLEVIKALLALHPSQNKALQDLEKMVLQRVEFARELTAAKRQREPGKIEHILSEDDDGGYSFAVGRQIQQIRAFFTGELSRMDHQAFDRDRQARAALYLGSSLSFLTVLGSVWFIRDNLSQRRRATHLLETANDSLEREVTTRTADLDTKVRELSLQNLESAWQNEALNHQLRYNNRIIEVVSDLVFVVTKIGNITRINPAVEAATGVTSDQLIGRPLWNIISGSIDEIANALKHGFDLLHTPIDLQLKSAPPAAHHLRLFPLRDNDQVIGAVVILNPRPSTPKPPSS
jgi:CHASE3 domain sensor protein